MKGIVKKGHSKMVGAAKFVGRAVAYRLALKVVRRAFR